MKEAFVNMFRIPELRRKILITLGLLLVYRLGCSLPVPGVNAEALSNFMDRAAEQPMGKVLGLAAMVSGSAFQRLTVFTLGVMPYISATIIFQLLTGVIPKLEELQKEGESGRRKIRSYERYLTVGLAVVQSFFVILYLQKGQLGLGLVPNTTGFLVRGVFCITTGSVFLMWLGDQISTFGIGNGISLIIMAGIISRLPVALQRVITRGVEPVTVIVLLVVFVAIVAGVVTITQAQRRIPIQQAKHIRGRRVYGSGRQYLPMRVNQAGVIPIIFASSLMAIPAMILGGLARFWPPLKSIASNIGPGGSGFAYSLIYVMLIILFCFFWTRITFKPPEIADNLKDSGSFVPGIRPGRPTAEYLGKIMNRVTLVGAVFLAVIAILPTLLSHATKLEWLVTGFYGGTGLLIVVGVALDLIERIEMHLLMRHYQGFLRGTARVRGRR